MYRDTYEQLLYAGQKTSIVSLASSRDRTIDATPDAYTSPQPYPEIVWRSNIETDADAFCARLRTYWIGHALALSEFLFEAARSGPGEGWIVEIGTEWGHGTCLLAGGSKAANREKVITIDSDKGTKQSLYDTRHFWQRTPMRQAQFHTNLLFAGVQDWVVPIGWDSRNVAAILDVRIRLLFIDGGHEYEPCSNDILLFGDKMVSGGIIVIDDYNMRTVAQAVDDHIVSSKRFSHIVAISKNTVVALKQ